MVQPLDWGEGIPIDLHDAAIFAVVFHHVDEAQKELGMGDGVVADEFRGGHVTHSTQTVRHEQRQLRDRPTS